MELNGANDEASDGESNSVDANSTDNLKLNILNGGATVVM